MTSGQEETLEAYGKRSFPRSADRCDVVDAHGRPLVDKRDLIGVGGSHHPDVRLVLDERERPEPLQT